MIRYNWASQRYQTWSPDASITGGLLTGFTTPAYAEVVDTPPAINAKQMTVTGITGGATAKANSAVYPFTASFYKPQQLKALPPQNPVTGLRGQVPTNQYKLIIRKGCDVAAGVPALAICRVTWDLPAGMETYAADDLKALVSYLVGLLTEECQDLFDTLQTSVL